MKKKSSVWCKVQEFLLEMKCPGCFSKEIELKECECDTDDNVECKDCGCTFKVNSEVARARTS
jgi:hypothetical protein